MIRSVVLVSLIALAAPATAAELNAADKAAAFKAAGFKQRGQQWTSDCNQGGAPYDPPAVEQVADFNGDGRLDAVITEGGTFCYGNTGTGFFLVSKQADGSWKKITSDTGIATILKTKGVAGWPDIEVGGPGFCFPVQRWNGKEYAPVRFQYEGKACQPQR